jgi:hypothetical protein
MIHIDARISFDNVQLVAGKVSSAVKPRETIESGDIDHEGLAFPASI